MAEPTARERIYCQRVGYLTSALLLSSGRWRCAACGEVVNVVVTK